MNEYWRDVRRHLFMLALLLAIMFAVLRLFDRAVYLAQQEPELPLAETLEELVAIRGDRNFISNTFTRFPYGPNPRQVYYLAFSPHVPDDEPLKLVILVHGGAFVEGGPDDYTMVPLARFFLERGYAVVSMGYRLLSDNLWPVPLTDINQGTRAVLIQLENRVAEVNYVGYSAGAVAGTLMLYTDQYEPLPVMDRFIGISGLYSPHAVTENVIQYIRERSMENLNILDEIVDIKTPRTGTPALLIQGTADHFADRFPGTPQSHAETLRQTLCRHNVYAETFWASGEGMNDHEGPVMMLALRNRRIVEAVDSFMRRPVMVTGQGPVCPS